MMRTILETIFYGLLLKLSFKRNYSKPTYYYQKKFLGFKYKSI